MPESIENQFLQQLEKMQAQWAREAVEKPKDKTEFGFGKACGVSEGLCRAKHLFDAILGEENDRK